jgi:hypothetical protein
LEIVVMLSMQGISQLLCSEPRKVSIYLEGLLEEIPEEYVPDCLLLVRLPHHLVLRPRRLPLVAVRKNQITNKNH